MGELLDALGVEGVNRELAVARVFFKRAAHCEDEFQRRGEEIEGEALAGEFSRTLARHLPIETLEEELGGKRPKLRKVRSRTSYYKQIISYGRLIAKLVAVQRELGEAEVVMDGIYQERVQEYLRRMSHESGV